MRKLLSGIGIAGLVVTATMLPTGAQAATQDACGGNYMVSPNKDCGSFKNVYMENFNGLNTPVGQFSQCDSNSFACAGLKQKYSRYYNGLGAYPSGWPDTATSGADGNGGRSFGGYYRPEKTISVVTHGTDGQLEVKMTSNGSVNNVAAVVPRKCTFRYGKWSERFIVRQLTPGFKMAHLHYAPAEIDYPEAGGNFDTDPISAFTHSFTESGQDVASNSAWKSWHTYSTEVTPGHIKFFFDGNLVQQVNADYPAATEWVLQNESALAGSYAKAGSSVTIDTTWIECWKY